MKVAAKPRKSLKECNNNVRRTMERATRISLQIFWQRIFQNLKIPQGKCFYLAEMRQNNICHSTLILEFFRRHIYDFIA